MRGDALVDQNAVSPAGKASNMVAQVGAGGTVERRERNVARACDQPKIRRPARRAQASCGSCDEDRTTRLNLARPSRASRRCQTVAARSQLIWLSSASRDHSMSRSAARAGDSADPTRRPSCTQTRGGAAWRPMNRLPARTRSCTRRAMMKKTAGREAVRQTAATTKRIEGRRRFIAESSRAPRRVRRGTGRRPPPGPRARRASPQPQRPRTRGAPTRSPSRRLKGGASSPTF